MPRRNYRRRDAEAPLDPLRMRRGVERVQAQPDGDWLVRNVPGSDKAYRCPGCDQEIPAGVGHLVTWPADERGDLADRRHWHTGCWGARDRRRPTAKHR
ncbi:MAG: hypothetical protein AUI14_18140 [Actinobacteria bacterium 13_2_20CM_2_71_6]|nr:MAG: hypothetical protein AUI14_18140 [Actinobacteria bacterium 13_2_20CM_2_71_6]